MLDEMTALFKFSEKHWEDHIRNWEAWWAGELERPLLIIEYPPRHRLPEEVSIEFLADTPVDQYLDYYQARLEDTQLFADAWPKWFPFFGAGVVAAFLGAELFCAPQEMTIWFKPRLGMDEFDLIGGYAPDNFWWQRIQAITQGAVGRWGRQVCVGYTDLGGNMDILSSLQDTQTLLTDLVDRPQQVEAASQQITGFWFKYHARLNAITEPTGRGHTPWAPVWAPGSCYMFQSDFSAMISPKMFERFILPELAESIQQVAYAFYHMDGKGQIPHLDALLSIENLRGIQWIPGDGQPPPEEWLPLLKRIRDGEKLCQLFVSAEGALKIVRELGGKGFAFYILDALDEDGARAFVDEINSS